MPTPIQALRDYFKTLSESVVDQRSLFENDDNKKIRDLFATGKKMADDPNFVDITPKHIPAKWYQDAADPAFAPSVPMRVMRPPMTRTPTQVVGGPEFARRVEKFMTEFPETRGRVNNITHGPTLGVMNELGNSGMGAQEYEDSNIMGLFDYSTRGISINPNLRPGSSDFDQTLGHEFGHAFNLGDNKKSIGPLEQLIKLYSQSKDHE